MRVVSGRRRYPLTHRRCAAFVSVVDVPMSLRHPRSSCNTRQARYCEHACRANRRALILAAQRAGHCLRRPLFGPTAANVHGIPAEHYRRLSRRRLQIDLEGCCVALRAPNSVRAPCALAVGCSARSDPDPRGSLVQPRPHLLVPLFPPISHRCNYLDIVALDRPR